MVEHSPKIRASQKKATATTTTTTTTTLNLPLVMCQPETGVSDKTLNSFEVAGIGPLAVYWLLFALRKINGHSFLTCLVKSSTFVDGKCRGYMLGTVLFDHCLSSELHVSK